MNLARSREHIRAQIERLRITHPDIMDDDELFQLALESETDITEFLGRVVKRMIEADTMVKAQTIELKELHDRRDRYEARHDAMRSLAFNVMQDAALKKIELPTRTLSIRMGTPKVIITDEAALPDNLVRIKREPYKVAIKLAIENGITVPGATLSNAEPTLMVTK